MVWDAGRTQCTRLRTTGDPKRVLRGGGPRAASFTAPQPFKLRIPLREWDADSDEAPADFRDDVAWPVTTDEFELVGSAKSAARWTRRNVNGGCVRDEASSQESSNESPLWRLRRRC